jgi:glycosyltransferase involved in cell wall biosynthesis
LSEALADRGHEVHVYTANSTDYMSWTGNLPPRELLRGVHVHRFRAIPRRARTWAVLRRGLYPYLERPRLRYEPLIMVGNGPVCPGLFLDLATAARRFDLVHLSSLHYAHTAYGYAAARLAGLPVAVTPLVHAEQRETWDVGYMRRILAHADLIFALTEYERRFHISQGRDPDRVITTGVGLRLEDYAIIDQASARRRLGIPQEAQVVLCMGRQVQYKGMDRVLSACRDLLPSHPNLLVLIAGPESEWSREVMAEYAGAAWVRNLGQVDEATKLAALSAAALLAMPSHGESFGITYLESWLAARPVVGLCKGAVQDLISDGEDGILVPPDDQGRLRQAIATLLECPEQAAAMGQRGRGKALARYTLDAITDIVEGAYERLLAAKETKIAR